MDFNEFIKPELLVLIPVLYFVGIAIKNSEIKSKWIPLILGGIGIALSTLYVFGTSDVDGANSTLIAIFTAITQGILCAGASVYVNQIVKQAKKEE